jgi:hypothetical protein
MIAELIIALGFLRNQTSVTSTPTQETPTTIKGKSFGESLLDLPPQVLTKKPVHITSYTGTGVGSADIRRQRRELFK